MNKLSLLPVLLLAAAAALPLLAESQTAQDGRLPKVADAPPGGDFTLHMGDESFSLEDLRGKVVLLYFGYTKCPDVCPTSLSYQDVEKVLPWTFSTTEAENAVSPLPSFSMAYGH